MMGIMAVRRVSTRILSLLVNNRRMSSISISKLSPSPSPWLVLKPNRTSYKFYCLEEKREFDYRTECLESDVVEEMADNTLKVVGSSYGWLALLNKSNNDLYLLDPIRERHVRLPNLNTLPDPDKNLIGGRSSVSKLILSCSPNERDACSVLITYGVGNWLAWCSLLPDDSRWVPVGDHSPETFSGSDILHTKLYYDIVYCSRRKLFACLAFPFRIMFDYNGEIAQEYKIRHKCQLEFLQDTPPKWTAVDELSQSCFNFDDDYSSPSWIDQLSGKEDWPIQTTHLVYAEESDNLYLLVQLFEGSPPVPLYDNDFSPLTRDLNNDAYLIFKHKQRQKQHYTTVAFVAFKYYKWEGSFEISVVDSLEGLAMFVGANQSFAISPSKFPELNLKPNSVYFTDINGSRINCTYNGIGNEYEGGVDAGIFDYENNVILRFSKLAHEPFWFTPNK